MSIKVVSIFSGAGGLDLGFKNAGYNIVSSAEIMKDAVATHNLNFKLNCEPIDLTNNESYSNFINQIKTKHKKIDLLIGGFPCQGYSLSGNRDVNDPRNQLYRKVVSVLNDLSISNFVLENVPGILSINDGKEFKKIEKYFNDNGYFFKYSILDSSNFDVPQKRKRIIFFGYKNVDDLSKIENISKELESSRRKIVTVKEAIDDIKDLQENKQFNHIYTRHTEHISKKIKELEVNKSLYAKYSDGWRKIDYHKPSPTVKENHGGVHLHPIKNRALTPRELARLQSFPDTFIFLGSKKNQLVQIGNAVPVKFAEHIAKKYKKVFLNGK